MGKKQENINKSTYLKLFDQKDGYYKSISVFLKLYERLWQISH